MTKTVKRDYNANGFMKIELKRRIYMEKLSKFRNNEFREIEILEIDGKPYFPASACAKVLGYAVPRKRLSTIARGF